MRNLTIQVARSRGVRVLADAAPAEERLVRELGADIVAHRRGRLRSCAKRCPLAWMPWWTPP
ncbi:hypothetical protein [Streptomyces sp. NPDC005336]|uniref:hypothetical protein n=1 Tax=Streptomyces sp. NPDC005336 TaxID=3157035 RepID=UPI0033AD0EEB